MAEVFSDPVDADSPRRKLQSRRAFPSRPSDPRTTKGILIETLNRPSTVVEEVLIIEAPDWKSPIIKYLKNPTTDTKSESAKLRILAARYVLIDDVLYKKSFNLQYLRCLGLDEAHYVLRKIHEGICGNHLGSRSLSHKTLRQGYY